MYVPPHFAEPRIEVMHDLMRARPLATVVTLSTQGIDANHVPLHLSQGEGVFGILRGHIARANVMGQTVVPHAEALAIFHGPDSYVSPSWYPTKQENHKAVPTWNFAVVHAYGSLRIVDDAEWIREHLDRLTAEHEALLPEPWSPADAPSDFIRRLAGAIVGIELTITRLTGKWKLSQNQPPANREGVIAALRQSGTTSNADLATLMESALRDAD